MSIRVPQRLLDPQMVRWSEPTTGKPTTEFYTYMRELDTAVRRLLAITNPVTVANLPTGSEGDIAFASNGRKAGEGGGAGTGVLVFHDGSNWIAVDTGATVAA